MQKYIVSAFYKFVELENFSELRLPILKLMGKYQLLGTVLLASEGINGSVSGLLNNVTAFHNWLLEDSRFADMEVKLDASDIIPFEKAKVKLKKEIVTMGIDNIDSINNTGTMLSPEAWNELIKDPEVCVIDTRNNYEFSIGTFKNAINPETESFREFPSWVETHLMDKKDKKIAMFCTGGIRCEKSTAWMKQVGFREVYQLHGGILNYFKQMPTTNSLWEGDCFVFDNRITVGETDTVE